MAAAIRATDIEKLRLASGAGVMDCKRALQDAQGDFDKALSIIQERGLVKAEKRAGRATGAGVIESYIHNNRVGVLLIIRSETDFVARSEPFKQLAHDLVMQIAAINPENIDALLASNFIKDENMTIQNLVKSVIARVGENIQIEKFIRYEL